MQTHQVNYVSRMHVNISDTFFIYASQQHHICLRAVGSYLLIAFHFIFPQPKKSLNTKTFRYVPIYKVEFDLCIDFDQSQNYKQTQTSVKIDF